MPEASEVSWVEAAVQELIPLAVWVDFNHKDEVQEVVEVEAAKALLLTCELITRILSLM